YKDLVKIVGKLPENTSVVECGPWLGSTTAFLLLGIEHYKKNIKLYAFDKWEADNEYIDKAKKYNGLIFTDKTKLKKIFLENISRFSPAVIATVSDVTKIEYRESIPISLLVDDTGGWNIEHIISRL